MKRRSTNSLSAWCRYSSAKAYRWLHRGIVRCRCGCYLRDDFQMALFRCITRFSSGRRELNLDDNVPFVLDRNVPLSRPPCGGLLGADRDEQARAGRVEVLAVCEAS